MKPNSARKAAQRAISVSFCEMCGLKSGLQRHHPDILDPLNVVILCQPCHAAVHVADGTWGNGKKQPKKCVVCLRLFDYRHSLNKTCSRECLSELGRMNARKRWDRTRAAE